MTRTLVYKFGADAPHEEADRVREQMRAAHDYRNDLVQIERGRRWALRQLEVCDDVLEAEEALRTATRSDRNDRKKALKKARELARYEARCEGGHWAVPETEVDNYPYSPLFELERIQLLEASMQRSARALTTAYWGNYLLVEQSHAMVRASSLYDDDGLTVRDPRFVRWHCVGAFGDGHVGIQLQGGLSTPHAFAGQDTRVRLIRGERGWHCLWLRVGSEGRAPIWAKFHIRVTRAIPDAATWKWVRVSCRAEGPFERWSCEITVTDPSPRPRDLDTTLTGTLAVEVAWDRPDDELIVARWRDDAGHSGELPMPRRDFEGITKSSSFRSVRDTLANSLRPMLVRALTESRDVKPTWLMRTQDELAAWHTKSPLWQTPAKFRDLYYRWQRERCDAAREAFEVLDAWEKRDRHLWEYEAGMRGQVLRRRREMYRVQAAQWSRKYAHVILDDRVLTREARFGEASDLRFIAAPAELRGAIRQAFGDSVTTYPWQKDKEEDERGWCERAIDARSAGIAREGRKPKKTVHGEGGAWSSRKTKKIMPRTKSETARKASCNDAK